MKVSRGPQSVNIKVVLLILALIIALSTLYYTQNIVRKLQQNQKRLVELYANSYEHIISTSSDNSDFTFLFENVIKRIDFPLILTDGDDKVTRSTDGYEVSNLEYDSTLSESELLEYFAEKIKAFDAAHEPISVEYSGIVLSRIHYGDSELINSLKYYPFIQIIIALLFIIIGYVSFSYIKKTEQSNIWVGMAKETAHQLGTPISSLMGWNEILKMNLSNPDKVLDASDEIGNDLTRLDKIANRFSKIGSKPALEQKKLKDIFEKVFDYFNRRLPQTNKRIKIETVGDSGIVVQVNEDLFEWVLENLIKNAVQSLESNEGAISFKITDRGKSVEIDVTDTGKGIDMRKKKDIFRPGYSTKRRGWGLGLSLSKRIIEDYHKGKIFLKASEVGNGSTFSIILNKQ